MSATFDTLALAQALRDKAKFTPEQAEGTAEALASALSGGLATKADLREVEAALKAEIARLETRIEATANRNLIAIIAVGGLIVAALKLL